MRWQPPQDISEFVLSFFLLSFFPQAELAAKRLNDIFAVSMEIEANQLEIQGLTNNVSLGFHHAILTHIIERVLVFEKTSSFHGEYIIICSYTSTCPSKRVHLRSRRNKSGVPDAYHYALTCFLEMTRFLHFDTRICPYTWECQYIWIKLFGCKPLYTCLLGIYFSVSVYVMACDWSHWVLPCTF